MKFEQLQSGGEDGGQEESMSEVYRQRAERLNEQALWSVLKDQAHDPERVDLLTEPKHIDAAGPRMQEDRGQFEALTAEDDRRTEVMAQEIIAEHAGGDLMSQIAKAKGKRESAHRLYLSVPRGDENDALRAEYRREYLAAARAVEWLRDQLTNE